MLYDSVTWPIFSGTWKQETVPGLSGPIKNTLNLRNSNTWLIPSKAILQMQIPYWNVATDALQRTRKQNTATVERFRIISRNKLPQWTLFSQFKMKNSWLQQLGPKENLSAQQTLNLRNSSKWLTPSKAILQMQMPYWNVAMGVLQ